jgi:hypothetical protein
MQAVVVAEEATLVLARAAQGAAVRAVILARARLEQQTLAAAAVEAEMLLVLQLAALEVQELSFCPSLRQTILAPQLAHPPSLQAALTPSSSSRHQGVTQREPLCESL